MFTVEENGGKLICDADTSIVEQISDAAYFACRYTDVVIQPQSFSNLAFGNAPTAAPDSQTSGAIAVIKIGNVELSSLPVERSVFESDGWMFPEPDASGMDGTVYFAEKGASKFEFAYASGSNTTIRWIEIRHSNEWVDNCNDVDIVFLGNVKSDELTPEAFFEAWGTEYRDRSNGEGVFNFEYGDRMIWFNTSTGEFNFAWAA